MKKTKIPKVVHYCWFGGKPLNKQAKACIRSWKKYLPDYTFKLWNEKNFNVYSQPFVADAYKAKKWAYITDYLRLYALYHFGGVYMDTDVEVVKPLDRFLVHSAFSGFEDPEHIPTGMMAAEKGNLWIKQLLDYYRDKRLKFKGKNSVLRTNTLIITELSRKFGFRPGNKYQVLKYDVHIYPKKYFCPLEYDKRHLPPPISANTYTIHYYAGSWVPQPAISEKIISRTKDLVRKLIPARLKKIIRIFS
jgi:mannosyltransferase OCH1-like enzyme